MGDKREEDKDSWLQIMSRVEIIKEPAKDRKKWKYQGPTNRQNTLPMTKKENKVDEQEE